MEERGHRPDGGKTLQTDQRPPKYNQQQSHYECGVQDEECMGDRGAPRVESKPVVQKTKAAPTREKGDYPGTAS